MANAKRCDICGAFYEHEENYFEKDPENINGIMFVNGYVRVDRDLSMVIDCCPTCIESIKKHMNHLSEQAGFKRKFYKWLGKDD